MTRPDGDRSCVNCGDPVKGPGDVCADCTPAIPPGTSICPYCRDPIPWEKMRRYKRSHAQGSVEVLYYCPSCRAVLEAACWMER